MGFTLQSCPHAPAQLSDEVGLSGDRPDDTYPLAETLERNFNKPTHPPALGMPQAAGPIPLYLLAALERSFNKPTHTPALGMPQAAGPIPLYLLAALERSFNKPTHTPALLGMPQAAGPIPLYLTSPSPFPPGPYTPLPGAFRQAQPSAVSASPVLLPQALKAGYCIQATGPKLPKPEPKPMPLPLPGELTMAVAAMGGPGLP